METLSKSMSMRFLVVLSVSGLHFGSKFGRHKFSVNSFISKVFFPSTSFIFDVTIATRFARDSLQQYHFMHKCNSMLNSLSSIAKQNVVLPLSMQSEAYYLEASKCSLYVGTEAYHLICF